MQGIYYLAEKTQFVDNYGDDWVARLVGDGLPTALLGILTVFAVLALLWGCLEIFKYVFYTIPERNKNGGAVKVEKPAPAPVAPVAPVSPFSGSPHAAKPSVARLIQSAVKAINHFFFIRFS